MSLLFFISTCFAVLDTNELTKKNAKILDEYFIGLYYPKFAYHYNQHPKALRYPKQRVYFHKIGPCSVTMITDNSLIIRDVVIHNKECVE